MDYSSSTISLGVCMTAQRLVLGTAIRLPKSLGERTTAYAGHRSRYLTISLGPTSHPKVAPRQPKRIRLNCAHYGHLPIQESKFSAVLRYEQTR